ncbi:hypothetical protein [Pelagibius sp. Alg239-R121]|uniref:hypothetical protein n=1 Tax=Pelagibius sp. Alg239-R121 TaxID=2993448 RepID=UPI0024A717E2|nr:hypothetical protein [Pelagibius sp. Alg239-R121]
MAQTLKRQAGIFHPAKHGEADLLKESTLSASAPRKVAPSPVRTLGELAVRAGVEREPVVRRWQQLINTAVVFSDQIDNDTRWNHKQSISFLCVLSVTLWGLIVIGATEIF